jgi:hypothetical protein
MKALRAVGVKSLLLVFLAGGIVLNLVIAQLAEKAGGATALPWFCCGACFGAFLGVLFGDDGE